MEGIRRAAQRAAEEFLQAFPMAPGSLFVLGGSTSEVLGERVGTRPSLEAAHAVQLAPEAAQDPLVRPGGA